MSRRVTSIVICAAVALLAIILLPGTMIDRAAFSLTARSLSKNPSFTSGSGSHSAPYKLSILPDRPTGTPSEFPLDIAITDDPDNVFQSTPPSPVDFAVILKNLQRLGIKNVAISTPLAWQEPDAISLTALDLLLDSFASPVTSAPLTRNPVPSPMPPAFRRGSIPLSGIHGSMDSLPIVNRVSIPDAILGNKTSLAAFTILESEPKSDFLPMLARWEGEDRAVFSFHLLAVLSHFQIPPSSVEIHIGKYISLGKTGLYLPIDKFGRLTFPKTFGNSPASIRAGNLIDSPEDSLHSSTFHPAIIRNTLSAAAPTTADFSKNLIHTVATLSRLATSSEIHTYRRLPFHIELLVLTSLLSLLYGFRNYSWLSGKLPIVLLAAFLLALHFLLVSKTHTWIPTIPALLAISAYALLKRFIKTPIEAPQPAPRPPESSLRFLTTGVLTAKSLTTIPTKPEPIPPPPELPKYKVFLRTEN